MEASVPVASGPLLAAADIANEPFLEDPVEHAARDRRAAQRLAIAMGLAILLHLVVVALTVVAPDWWRRAEPPKAIPITLVAEPPQPPPPPPPAEKPPEPKPEPPPLPYARSGPDEKMASASPEQSQPVPSPSPPASEPTPQTAAQPATTPPTPAELPAPQPTVPAPEAMRPVPELLPSPKPATPKATPKQGPRASSNGAPHGERDMVGDPYLNVIYAKMMRNLRYPEPFRRDGLMGVAHFELFVARSGEVVRVLLTRSSGNSAIDLYAEEVVRRLAPLPPIPARLVGEVIIIDADVPVGPSSLIR